MLDRERSNRRRWSRTDIQVDGFILYGEKQIKMVLEDLSPKGAKLRVDGEQPGPSSYDIHVDRAGKFPVHVRWRNENMLGVEFEDDAEEVNRRFGPYLELNLVPAVSRTGSRAKHSKASTGLFSHSSTPPTAVPWLRLSFGAEH